jgi:hypothetical protein
MFRYLVQCVVMINQTWKLTSVNSHGVKMTTELHHPEGRTGRVASVPEAPGFHHITSLHGERNMLRRYHKNIHFILVECLISAFGKAFCVKIRDTKIQLYELHFAFLMGHAVA